MSAFNQPTVSRQEFRRALNLRCNKEFGMGIDDLPDIICIDDVWWDKITEKEAMQMIDSCIDDFKDELDYKPTHTVDAPVYSIDE